MRSMQKNAINARSARNAIAMDREGVVVTVVGETHITIVHLSSMESDRPRRSDNFATGGGIALVGALVYVNALRNPFVYDDHRVILENKSLGNLLDWRAI